MNQSPPPRGSQSGEMLCRLQFKEADYLIMAWNKFGGKMLYIMQVRFTLGGFALDLMALEVLGGRQRHSCMLVQFLNTMHHSN